MQDNECAICQDWEKALHFPKIYICFLLFWLSSKNTPLSKNQIHLWAKDALRKEKQTYFFIMSKRV